VIKKKSYFKFLFFILTLSFIGSGTLPAEERISNVRYEIWIELDDQNKMLHGKENITWLNNTRDDVQDMWFHLYYNAFKNEKSTTIQESKEELIGAFGIKINRLEPLA
jgi:hypothetical protein